MATQRTTQERGRLRRRKLVEAAEQLLDELPLDSLTLGTVARAAGVPKASAYHFYKDIFDLYADLARNIGEELEKVIREIPFSPEAGWEKTVADILECGASYLDGKTSRRALIWGPKVPFEIKHSDRENDRKLSRIILERLNENFEVPEFPRREEIFYQAIEIADLMFCLCMLDHDRLTREALDDAQRATLAYLKSHLPSVLPRRDKDRCNVR